MSNKEWSNYRTIGLISHASKIMLKILPDRLQQYMTKNFQMYKLDLKRQRNQRSNCENLLDHRESKVIPENIYFCFTDHAKTFDCVDHNKPWKILKRDGNPKPLYLPLEKHVCRSRSNS